MERTPEHESLFDFTVPYMSLHDAIVVRSDETGIRELSDLGGYRVAVMKYDNALEFLRSESRGFEIRTTPTFEIALQDLAEGRHDAAVIQRLVVLHLIQKTGLTDLQVIDRSIHGFQQDFRFAVREGDRDTLALLSEGLAIVTADGSHDHGGIISILFAAEDITERKRGKKALQDSEEKFRALFENAPLGCQSLNADGDFIEINCGMRTRPGCRRTARRSASLDGWDVAGFLEGHALSWLKVCGRRIKKCLIGSTTA